MISVIIPYRDTEPWIGRCADSLRVQEGDFEFIFVNDNSEDESEAAARAAAGDDARFVFVDNDHVPGVSGARNTGLDHAAGEWVTFLDADDEMLENAYATYTSVIQADPEANIYQMNHMRYYTKIDNLVLKYANNAGVYHASHLPKMWFGVWNKIYKRAFLRYVRFKEGLQYGEDGLFILECLARDGSIHHARRDAVAVKHRFDNPRSLSKSKTRQRYIDYVHALEDFIMECKDTEIRIAVCDILSEHWGSEARKKTFAED